MPVLTLNQQIQELQEKVDNLRIQRDEQDQKIVEIRESMSEINEIVTEHAELKASDYQPKTPDISLPSNTMKSVSLTSLMNIMYKINLESH